MILIPSNVKWTKRSWFVKFCEYNAAAPLSPLRLSYAIKVLIDIAEVLSKPPDGNEPRLSGVGLDLDMEDGRDRVPLSYNARWDDDGRRFSDLRKVHSLQLDLGHQRKQGFPLHARCYTLLEEFFCPRPVPVARLEELCRSCPEQHSALNWGHDYGEGILLRHESHWDELDIESDIELRPEWYFDGDPLEIPELTKILYAAQLDRPKRMKRDFKQIHETVANCFTGLPHEILGYIIPYLPTDDVKALSRTCKGLQIYIPSELETSFWISRFQPPFEFDFFLRYTSIKVNSIGSRSTRSSEDQKRVYSH